MEFMQILGIGMVSAVLAIMLRTQKPEMAMLVGIAGGALILVLIAGPLLEAVQQIQSISQKFGLDVSKLTVVLKIIGLAYLCEFGVQICKDAGEGAIGSKVELAGKVLIVCAAMPLVMELLQGIASILGTAA